MIRNLIENKILEKEINKPFAAIIGLSPSKGARSPTLWNKVYKSLKKPIKMISLDCKKQNIKKLFNELQKNKNFIGGAITNPYKTNISNFLKLNQSKESRFCLSVNCLNRDKNNKLYGYNTDGIAALKTLSSKFKNIQNRYFLILGTGATASTLITYLTKKYKNEKKILVFGRNKIKLQKIKDKYKVKTYKLIHLSNLINRNSIIINCTSIGWGNQVNDTPINKKVFELLKKNKCGFFDLIYQPNKTKAINIANGLKISNINGKRMNLDQAVIAFKLVNKDCNISEKNVSNLMK